MFSRVVLMILKHLMLLTLVVALSGCSGNDDRESGNDLPQSSLPGVYTGVFPCADCPGIPTTLWLRSDGRYFYRQHYPEVGEREAMTAYSLGRWTAGDSGIELVGAGPVRIFVRIDEHAMLMQTDSELEHRLDRDAAAPEFLGKIRMTGMMRLRSDGASFTECLAGFVVPVIKGREFTRFRHQYRSVGERGKAIYVELEGRFQWQADGSPDSLTIERFFTVRTDRSC